jgi:hypothetical protein
LATEIREERSARWRWKQRRRWRKSRWKEDGSKTTAALDGVEGRGFAPQAG